MAQLQAATYAAHSEAESGSLSAASLHVNDALASGGAAIRFSPQATGGRIVPVSTAAQLTTAMQNALPGDTITLADGTYSGRFNSRASGSALAPISLVGSRKAILNGGALDSGYTFSLGARNSTQQVSHWRLRGFTITGGNKGIIFDNVQRSLIDDLHVHDIGEEAIHLRNHSSDNTIQNNTITKTGLDTQAYGEGIYIGSAVSNWSETSQGRADHSNRNKVLRNNISYTSAESIDIKEGTHDGLIDGNTFDGHGMCFNGSTDCNFADSFIDMKGEGYTISNNTGMYMHVEWLNGSATNDGFQVHVVSGAPAAEASGSDNTFTTNRLSDLDGYGFNIQSRAIGVVVKCNNTVIDAVKGFGNVVCRE